MKAIANAKGKNDRNAVTVMTEDNKTEVDYCRRVQY